MRTAVLLVPLLCALVAAIAVTRLPMPSEYGVYTCLRAHPTIADVMLVCDKNGPISLLNTTSFTLLPGSFADLTPLVNSSDERGLLDLAFHPDYAVNGLIFVHYSREGDGAAQISAFQTLAANPLQGDLSSLNVVWSYDRSDGYHYGGGIAFGPSDGMLYVAFGDGGENWNPAGNGQNTESALGKILRFNVTATNYSVPTDNVWANSPPNYPLIFAYGVRNPWRISFDSVSTDLWIGDVGQAVFEEVNMIVANPTVPHNLGWDCREGDSCYPGATCNCSVLPANYEPPVYSQPHTGLPAPWQGDVCSITGGIVYRGSAIPEFQGNYFYSDYCLSALWRIPFYATDDILPQPFSPLNPHLVGAPSNTSIYVPESAIVCGEPDTLPFGVATFGTDSAGELYYADAFSIYKLVPFCPGTTTTTTVSTSATSAVTTASESTTTGESVSTTGEAVATTEAVSVTTGESAVTTAAIATAATTHHSTTHNPTGHHLNILAITGLGTTGAASTLGASLLAVAALVAAVLVF